MTAQELIEQLSKLDPNQRVYYDDSSYGMSEIMHVQATIYTPDPFRDNTTITGPIIELHT